MLLPSCCQAVFKAFLLPCRLAGERFYDSRRDQTPTADVLALEFSRAQQVADSSLADVQQQRSLLLCEQQRPVWLPVVLDGFTHLAQPPSGLAFAFVDHVLQPFSVLKQFLKHHSRAHWRQFAQKLSVVKLERANLSQKSASSGALVDSFKSVCPTLRIVVGISIFRKQHGDSPGCVTYVKFSTVLTAIDVEQRASSRHSQHRRSRRVMRERAFPSYRADSPLSLLAFRHRDPRRVRTADPRRRAVAIRGLFQARHVHRGHFLGLLSARGIQEWPHFLQRFVGNFIKKPPEKRKTHFRYPNFGYESALGSCCGLTGPF
jgi:hypothetical protein